MALRKRVTQRFRCFLHSCLDSSVLVLRNLPRRRAWNLKEDYKILHYTGNNLQNYTQSMPYLKVECPAGVSLISWGVGASLALGRPSTDDIMIKIPYGVDVLLH